MNWHYVDLEDVILIHEKIIKRAGTTASIRDFALLHSAVERPKTTFSGIDLYPTVFAKAASLLQSICLNHAFSDGNKRSAWSITHRFLWLNGYHLKSSRMIVADFMVYADNSKPNIVEIAKWLKKHCKKRNDF